MYIISLILSFTVILTIATKIGFIVQRTYVDIRGIALSALLAIVTAFGTMGLPFMCIIATLTVYLHLLCKIGKTDLFPDTILATIIGGSALIIIMMDYIKDLNILYFFDI